MKMSEPELVALIDTLAQNSYGFQDGQLSQQRAEAIRRYNSEPYGDELEGRSSLVSSELRDTIETVTPQLMKVFLGGDEVVKFEPVGPQDEGQAQQETDYVNHCITQRNPVFQVFGTWFRDALLCKNGYVLAWWEKRQDVTLETYQGLQEDQLAVVQADPGVEIVAATPDEYGFYSIQVRRTRDYGYVRIDNVPPEEVLIHTSTRDVNFRDCIYLEHRTDKTLSEIRQMGYDIDDDDQGTESTNADNEIVARDRFSEFQNAEDESSDPSTRRATFRNIWIRVDEDGDGIAELRNIRMVNRKLLHDEECEFIPVACVTPVIAPHRHVGYGYWDFLQDIERARTAMLRAFFDNVYLANNGRFGVDVNKVNIDDLLVSRPGGLVRTDGPPGEAIFPITHPTTGETAIGAMQFLTDWKKSAVGVVLDASTLSADVLNKSTASAISQAVSAWQARIEAVARCFAETGVKELFRIVHALILQNGRPDQAKLGKDWVTVDPREWFKREHLTVTVGLGTGSKEMKLAQLYQFLGAQTQGMQIGIVNPENIYETAIEIVKEMGYKDEERFVTDPRKSPPQPKGPDPLTQAEMVKQQGAMQIAQLNSQTQLQVAAMNNAAKTDIEVANLAEQRALNIHKQDNENLRTAADVAMRMADHHHEDQHKVVDSLREIGLTQLGHAHDASMTQTQNAHSAQQGMVDKAFQAHQSDADRAHQAQLAKDKPKPNGK
jgi:hypothetical protein